MLSALLLQSALYSSFWLLAAMSLLTALVGINYMAICKHYPDGGGVYASVRHRSEIVSIVGAFLLIADYIVTAALSALSAFQYLGISHPEVWAGFAILCIGGLNFFGPKHTGGLAFLVSVPTFVVVVLLGAFALPHLGEAIHNLKPLSGGFFQKLGLDLSASCWRCPAWKPSPIRRAWMKLIIQVASDANPNVSKTCHSPPSFGSSCWRSAFSTALLGLAMNALPNMVPVAPTPATQPPCMTSTLPAIRECAITCFR